MAKNGKKVRIFSALEVANICGVVNQTAINWIKNSHLKAFTTPGGQYRIYAEDLLEFLNSRGMRVPEELYRLTREEGREKILIIDDDRDLNSMLKEFLGRKFPQFDLFQAYDGFEAGIILSEQKPGIVILDIDLPGVDGFKLCSRIKSGREIGKPIVVAVSGLDEQTTQRQILAEGADAFFPKPIDLEQLLSTLQSMVR